MLKLVKLKGRVKAIEKGNQYTQKMEHFTHRSSLLHTLNKAFVHTQREADIVTILSPAGITKLLCVLMSTTVVSV